MPLERRLQCLCFWPIVGQDTVVSFATALPKSVLFDRRKAWRQSQDDIQVLSAVDWTSISKQVLSRFHKLPPLCFLRKCSIPPTWFSVFTVCFPAFSGMCALAEAVCLPRLCWATECLVCASVCQSFTSFSVHSPGASLSCSLCWSRPGLCVVLLPGATQQQNT